MLKINSVTRLILGGSVVALASFIVPNVSRADGPSEMPTGTDAFAPTNPWSGIGRLPPLPDNFIGQPVPVVTPDGVKIGIVTPPIKWPTPQGPVGIYNPTIVGSVPEVGPPLVKIVCTQMGTIIGDCFYYINSASPVAIPAGAIVSLLK